MGKVIRVDFRAGKRLPDARPRPEKFEQAKASLIADKSPLTPNSETLTTPDLITRAAQAIVSRTMLEDSLIARTGGLADGAAETTYQEVDEALIALSEDEQEQAWLQAYRALGIT